MVRNRWVEFTVGVFIILAALSFLFLAFQVSGLTHFIKHDLYTVKADFQNVGDLKSGAPVTISGVTVGHVSSIGLNKRTFEALVVMQIESKTDKIPVDSTASIFTAGIIGANYISITPGVSDKSIADGGVIVHTNEALILQNLISKFVGSKML